MTNSIFQNLTDISDEVSFYKNFPTHWIFLDVTISRTGMKIEHPEIDFFEAYALAAPAEPKESIQDRVRNIILGE